MSQRVKWLFDRASAAAVILVSAPLMALIAVGIMIDDGRPVLFVHQRAGKSGRPFPMLKFRSMIRGAVAAHHGVTEDPFGVVRDDPRFTRTGRFLRRTSLDELPQLFNVLAGQMSMIGPRPDLLEQVAHYVEADRRRLAVRPGITGWAQVHGRDAIGWPERIALDVWYVEHWSLWLDVKILLLTLAQVFRPEPDPAEDTMNIERLRRSRDA